MTPHPVDSVLTSPSPHPRPHTVSAPWAQRTATAPPASHRSQRLLASSWGPARKQQGRGSARSRTGCVVGVGRVPAAAAAAPRAAHRAPILLCHALLPHPPLPLLLRATQPTPLALPHLPCPLPSTGTSAQAPTSPHPPPPPPPPPPPRWPQWTTSRLCPPRGAAATAVRRARSLTPAFSSASRRSQAAAVAAAAAAAAAL